MRLRNKNKDGGRSENEVKPLETIKQTSKLSKGKVEKQIKNNAKVRNSNVKSAIVNQSKSVIKDVKAIKFEPEDSEKKLKSENIVSDTEITFKNATEDFVKCEFNPVPQRTCGNLSSDSDSDFEEVDNVKIFDNNLPNLLRNEKSESGNEKPKPALISKTDIVENVENMLRMEQLNNFRSNNKIEEIEDGVDDEDDFEEVEMKDELNISSLKNREPIQVNIDNGKSKKKIDMAAKMSRMLKALRKQLSIEILKSHLVCWLAHGFYLNKICLSPEIRACALSMIDVFEFEEFQLINFDKALLKKFLKTISQKIELVDKETEFLYKNSLVNEDTMCEAISKLKCASYLEYIMIILTLLRNMSLKVRLCVCFDVHELNEDSKKLEALMKTDATQSKNDTKPKTSSVKRKSDAIKDESSESKKEKSMPKKKRKSSTRLSSKLSNMKDEGFSEDEIQVDKEWLSSDSESPKKSTKSKNKTVVKKKVKSDQESYSEEKERSKSSINNKRPKTKNSKILSSDDTSESNERSETKNTRETCYKNYWLEIYLEEEKIWQCIDPLCNKIFIAGYEFEERFEKQILYACAFDNDNKVKDVTKRYSKKWTTTTRTSRIDFVEKKLWWEKTLMHHQILDANIDIEEEQNLKKMLLSQGLPTSLSEFKDHPLYVMERHLLKFQAIYPSNAKPLGYFRNEPVYSRDNHATLHSRQTWLKYARTVRLYEKPYKIVKGRIKQSDYKNGVRENPDLDTYGFWQTKPYDPPIAENGRIPLNEFGNVELFQPCMLPIGTVHLKDMPNLNRVCRKLKVDCAAAVVGFDAHSGFSHAVFDGWVVCEEHVDTVVAAFKEEEYRNNQKLIEKQQERVWGNWKRIIKSLQIREHLKFKYGTEKSDGYKISNGKTQIAESEKKITKNIENKKANLTSIEKKVKKSPIVLLKKNDKPAEIQKTTKPRSRSKKNVEYKENTEESEYDPNSGNDQESDEGETRKKVKKSAGKKKVRTAPSKRDIFEKIAAQNQIEIEKNSTTSGSVINQDDDLMLSEEEE